ncbi:hypothetical protein GIB67_031088 [Kingdonia uniflora]|uniref:Pentatricopeptide repeat-containing protein n=1 Tax=Kingdonia uniflora TaxID=39325 RepID=A0A7J7L9Y6_9MAGN|nr:hypothetical protein GIB67_031088 [Kingdonia uniflora]
MCRNEEISPDNYTLAALSKVSSEIGDVRIGETVHCWIIKTGFVSDTVLMNSVMAMYLKCGSFRGLREVFDKMPQRNSASWNVLISGFSVFNSCMIYEDVWMLVKQMQKERVRLDAYTISTLLPMCDGKWNYGREIHCFIVKNESALDYLDVHVGSCLIDMYSKRKKVTLGRRVFDRMECRNIVAWTAIIMSYIQNGDCEEALALFQRMQFKVEPNRVSLISVLPACSSLNSLMGGKQIHGFAIRNEFNHQVSLNNALIDMYCKCGDLSYAKHVFDNDAYCKDEISWSSIIAGYGLHGKGNEAVSLFNGMLQMGIKPNNITLVGVISGCGRSGLVKEGLNIYNSAVTVYGISPTVEACACVVDMLGRAGQLDRALEFINSMPVKPSPSVWGALFGASVLHENLEMQEIACKFLIQLEPENSSNYISLSNVYASSGRWDVVAELRKRMKSRGLRKLPGCSWV